MKTVQIKNAKNTIDADLRATYLENIEKFADTDVLKILSDASKKPNINSKVRSLKKFI